MRIRKRQVPLSDPLPIHPSPMVQLPLPSSDHPLPAATAKEQEATEGETPHHTGNGFILLGSGTVSEATPLSPSHLDDVKWCVDGEKAMPPKKRRGRGGDYMMVNTTATNNNKKMKTRMKTKMNKKCTTLNNEDDRDEDVEEEEEEEEEERKEEVMINKKRGRGSVVMEGSRCSRVNGRGWRCCQQTLVGYSLCEHHLGKGRLRSITSVKTLSTSSTTAPTNNANDASSSSSPDKKSRHNNSSAIHNNEIDEKKPAVVTKKRMKLGMVKARSISSLLGQTDNLVTLHDRSNK